jgi:arabinan endo-1,5-alpha-L-arabinosidase
LLEESLAVVKAIDPQLFIDPANNGQMYLTFGAYWNGIYTVQIDPARGLPIGTPVNLASNTCCEAVHYVEGADLMKSGTYYYLFFSHGYCCNGFSSTYDVRVGRSTSPTGPFYDEGNVNLVNGGGTVVLASHDYVVGPGGENLYLDPYDNKLFMLYHYWDTRYPESTGRVFGINAINFDSNGWPCWC